MRTNITEAIRLNSLANLGIEGISLDDEGKEMAEKYLNGAISKKQLLEEAKKYAIKGKNN